MLIQNKIWNQTVQSFSVPHMHMCKEEDVCREWYIGLSWFLLFEATGHIELCQSSKVGDYFLQFLLFSFRWCVSLWSIWKKIRNLISLGRSVNPITQNFVSTYFRWEKTQLLPCVLNTVWISFYVFKETPYFLILF